MVNLTYVKNKRIYNSTRSIKSIMERENIDIKRATHINIINHSIKQMKKLNPKTYKSDKKYINLFNEKLLILGIDPEKHKEQMEIKTIMRNKKLTYQDAKSYYYLTQQLLSFPRKSEEYKAAWNERKKIKPVENIQKNNETKDLPKENIKQQN